VAGLTFGAVTSVLTPTRHGKGKSKSYLAEPSNIDGKALMVYVVYVVHENRELNPCVLNVARRLAKQGLMAFVPDALLPLGGY
jgi:carboxymethylenebutenolidase